MTFPHLRDGESIFSSNRIISVDAPAPRGIISKGACAPSIRSFHVSGIVIMDIAGIIETVAKTAGQVTQTARGVNRDSHTRKEVAGRALDLAEKLAVLNDGLSSSFDSVLRNIDHSLGDISDSIQFIGSNVEYFGGIIENIGDIRGALDLLVAEIEKLTSLVDEIRDDTDEIFSLALNASIASSKYSHTSGVFDILADKLNEMSNFIKQNLEGIVHVVSPITKGINSLTEKNSVVRGDFEKGRQSFLEFPDVLEKQRVSIAELLERAKVSGAKIHDQKSMINDLLDQIRQMDSDADGAIEGSASVIRTGEAIEAQVAETGKLVREGKPYGERIGRVREQAVSIKKAAMSVNDKSKSQRDFSQRSVDFCDSLIAESDDLKRTTELFNAQTLKNSEMTSAVSKSLEDLSARLKDIDTNISDSYATIRKFNDDYSQIDNIVEFMKNIFKSMNVIGMLARIESARDPEEFASFITIADSIRKLQEKIQDNIPQIETNILKTHEIIDNVNSYFNSIEQRFKKLQESSRDIVVKLNSIIRYSSESESNSREILGAARDVEIYLGDLRGLLMELTEIVKKPIEGSSQNMERGALIESLCAELAGTAAQPVAGG